MNTNDTSENEFSISKKSSNGKNESKNADPRFWVLADTDGHLIPARYDPNRSKLDQLRDLIGCEWIEHVRTPLVVNGKGIHMIVDEEGLLKPWPKTNPFGSIVYGAQIVGRVVLCTIESGDEGDDLEPLDPDTTLSVVEYGFVL